MFEIVSRAAEHFAGTVSRRSFLGSLGAWSGSAAALLGGILSADQVSASHRRALRKKCCTYGAWGACGRVCVDANLQCPPGGSICGFAGAFLVKSCRQCG
jgi:hypothetical protein